MKEEFANDRAAVKSRIKAITAECMACCCGQIAEVEECPYSDCPLHPYRMDGARTPARMPASATLENNTPKTPMKTGGKNEGAK
jgi:hypothetical protein